MFTGLVETLGVVQRLDRTPGGAVLRIGCGSLAAELKPGESIAVDGACLTVVRAGPDWFAVEISPETLRRTVLGERAQGSRVNLERSLKAGDRLGGHLVQGHVDGVGTVTAVRPEGEGRRIRCLAPPGLERYVVEKGSVALDGVSLTVASLDSEGFEVSIIPHTLAQTTLSQWDVARRVNVEVDLVAKYVERLLGGWRTEAPAPAGGLAEKGWGRE